MYVCIQSIAEMLDYRWPPFILNMQHFLAVVLVFLQSNVILNIAIKK